jgi:hypothetical protein
MLQSVVNLSKYYNSLFIQLVDYRVYIIQEKCTVSWIGIRNQLEKDNLEEATASSNVITQTQYQNVSRVLYWVDSEYKPEAGYVVAVV